MLRIIIVALKSGLGLEGLCNLFLESLSECFWAEMFCPLPDGRGLEAGFRMFEARECLP